MSRDEQLRIFFQHSFEEDYNEKLFRRSYILPQNEVLEYVRALLAIPIEDFFMYMLQHNRSYSFSVREIPQYSSLDDATTIICKVLKDANDPGLSYVEVGILLRHDENGRKQGADQKYGENHSKTAADFGLVQISPLSRKVFLTCVGYIFNLLSQEEKNAYLARAILRNNFINCVLSRAYEHQIIMAEEMSILSPSTIARRLPNVKGYISLLSKSEGLPLSVFMNIRFK